MTSPNHFAHFDLSELKLVYRVLHQHLMEHIELMDADFFEAPDRFRVDRSPNPHVGFGIGEHFCLGANLARLEIRIALEQLIPRLTEIELAGPAERMRSSFLGGIKRMPIRYRLSPDA